MEFWSRYIVGYNIITFLQERQKSKIHIELLGKAFALALALTLAFSFAIALGLIVGPDLALPRSLS